MAYTNIYSSMSKTKYMFMINNILNKVKALIVCMCAHPSFSLTDNGK